MNDIIIVIGFVVFLILFCFVWNKLMMRSRKKIEVGTEGMFFDIHNISLKLVGIESDGNSDFEVARAIEKIDLPNDLRIKLDE